MSLWTGFIAYSFNELPPGLVSIIIISFLVTLFQILIYKRFSDQQRIKEIKERQKAINLDLRNARDEKKMKELNTEIMHLSTELMRLSMKPMIITLLPLLLVFWLLKEGYNNAGVGNIISWGANLPLIGNGAGWLLSFILFTLVFNLLLRKFLKVY